MPSYNNRGVNHQEKGSNKNAASTSKIGESFHNPYTFIPFPDEVERFRPTALTIDEDSEQKDYRLSGVLELTVKTISPLMSCSPNAISEKEGHKVYEALAIDNDVIVPATSIRGSLRTLMTILTGGTLGYMDENLWLTQGRDARLGPSTKKAEIPSNPFLAKVITPGNETRPGSIELGSTKLIKVDELKRAYRDLDQNRPPTGMQPLTHDGWDVKLSGTPINIKGKREGLFKGNGEELTLSEHYWKTYQGRHRHAAQSELKKGDLIWLEPNDPECQRITCEADIKSIQWSRWGRQGIKLKSIISEQHYQVLPDSMRNDGAVDWVTDLFGQVPNNKHVSKAAGPFAARIRPGNLIFFDGKQETGKETLAPLAAPHPGCIAFYRDQENLDEIDKNSPLKGYKVYRNSNERGDNAPWKYSVQGVYGEQGKIKSPYQKVNQTAELLNEGVTGKLRISFRSLDYHDLALLYTACSVDWKLGGGKPLGLGHCRVVGLKMYDEDGIETTPMGISDGTQNLKVDKGYSESDYILAIEDRIKLYIASQKPVNKLRYPRAVTKNNNKSSRAGLSWFSRHVSPKKTGRGLETMWTTGKLESQVGSSQIRAQALPGLDENDSSADLLYGYDMVELDINKSNQNQAKVGRIEKFEAEKHASLNEKSAENTSQNRESRQETRQQRTLRPEQKQQRSNTVLTKDNIGNVINAEFNERKIDAQRAKEILSKLNELGITADQSNKWGKKFKLLFSILEK